MTVDVLVTQGYRAPATTALESLSPNIPVCQIRYQYIYYYCHYQCHSYYCYHYHYFIIDTIIQVCMQYLPIPWIDTNGLASYETKHQNIQLAYWGHDVKYCTKNPISYYISLCNKAGLSCTFSWIHVLSKIKLCVFIGSSMVVTPACETTEEHWL